MCVNAKCYEGVECRMLSLHISNSQSRGEARFMLKAISNEYSMWNAAKLYSTSNEKSCSWCDADTPHWCRTDRKRKIAADRSWSLV
jgi:hypothetical protein